MTAKEDPSAYTRSAEVYDLIYHNKMGEMYEKMTEHIIGLGHDITGEPPRSVLDLGCGTGTFAIKLAQQGIHVTGIDLSEEQIAVAQQKLEGSDLDIDFLVGDMAHLPQLDRQYDLCGAFFSPFIYLLDDESVLSFLNNVYQYTRDGGILFYEFWNDLAYKPGLTSKLEIEEGNRRVIRVNSSTYDVQTGIVTMPMHHLVFEDDQLVDEYIETHKVRTNTLPHMKTLVTQTDWKIHSILGLNSESELVEAERDHFRYYAVLVK